MNIQEIWRKADEKREEYRSIGETYCVKYEPCAN